MRNKNTQSTLTIQSKEIEIVVDTLEQSTLRFYPENPRIFSIVAAGDDTPSQATIEEKLCKLDHVKQLVLSIRSNGGLTDPLIVRDDDLEVLEGNCRLAAYRLLARKDPIKWGLVKCHILPHDIDESMVFSLLGQYHIIGRKDWAPYEQAGYLYRRAKKHKVTMDSMASDLGLSKTEVSRMIRVYEFMVDNDDVDVQHWSYYEEYLKAQTITRARKSDPELDRCVVSKIKSGEIPKAVDVRDKLKKICALTGKKRTRVLTRFKKKGTFEDCYETAVQAGVENVIYSRLQKFREFIVDPKSRADMKDMPQEHKDKCGYELKKILPGVEKAKKVCE